MADGFLYIADPSGTTNSVNDDSDFAINAFDVQLRTERFGPPLVFGADYYMNFKGGPDDESESGATDGFVLYTILGDLAGTRHFQVGYYYAYIEKYAVARFLAQDDWIRFGTKTRTCSSDFKGHEIRVGYVFCDRVNLVARAYFVDTLRDAERGKRFRLDLIMRF